jgi:hypothetical protein
VLEGKREIGVGDRRLGDLVCNLAKHWCLRRAVLLACMYAKGTFGILDAGSPRLVGQGKPFGWRSPRLIARQACLLGQENPYQRRQTKTALLHGQGRLACSWEASSAAELDSPATDSPPPSLNQTRLLPNQPSASQNRTSLPETIHRRRIGLHSRRISAPGPESASPTDAWMFLVLNRYPTSLVWPPLELQCERRGERRQRNQMPWKALPAD